jgi:hypothetical protein
MEWDGQSYCVWWWTWWWFEFKSFSVSDSDSVPFYSRGFGIFRNSRLSWAQAIGRRYCYMSMSDGLRTISERRHSKSSPVSEPTPSTSSSSIPLTTLAMALTSGQSSNNDPLVSCSVPSSPCRPYCLVLPCPLLFHLRRQEDNSDDTYCFHLRCQEDNSDDNSFLSSL